MKRSVAFVLTVCVLLSFVACGGPSLTPTIEEAPASTERESAPAKSAPASSRTEPDRNYNMTFHPFKEIADQVALLGERTNITDPGLVLEWACSGFEMAFTTEGSDLVLSFDCSYTTFFKVYLDGEEAPFRLSVSGSAEKTAWKNVPSGSHSFRVIKDGQPDKNGGHCTLTGISLDGEITPFTAATKDLYLEFIGDSIWTGVGALGNQGSSPDYSSEISATVATPYRTAQALDADYNITARGSIGVVTKAGDLTASELFMRQNGYRDEVPYEPKRVPDAVVICLGANDPSSQADAFVEGGVALIDLIRDLYGDTTKIVWTNGMFSKTRFITEIQSIVERCGSADNGVYYLQMIYGQNGSGSRDNNRHPSSDDHEKNAAVLIPFLREIL